MGLRLFRILTVFDSDLFMILFIRTHKETKLKDWCGILLSKNKFLFQQKQDKQLKFSGNQFIDSLLFMTPDWIALEDGFKGETACLVRGQTKGLWVGRGQKESPWTLKLLSFWTGSFLYRVPIKSLLWSLIILVVNIMEAKYWCSK